MSLFTLPRQVVFVDGAIAPGGKAGFFLAGTVTQAAVYADSALTTELTNPVVADAEGVLPAIHLDPAVAYKVTVYNASDVEEYTEDNITVGTGRTAREIAAGITPTDYSYAEGNVKRYGAVGDGVTDDTAAFNPILTAGGFDIYIPSGTYIVDSAISATNGILVGSDTSIYCEPNVIIRIPDSGMSVNLGFMRFVDVTNFTLIGNGSVWEYNTKPTADEFRHIFDFRGVTDAYVENTVAKDSGGDGFYVGAGSVNNYSERVTLKNVRADNNRRQGMSIVSVKDLWVSDSIFENTTGTSPAAGIDIEPDVATHLLENIRINNCVTRNNAGDGIKIVNNDLPTTATIDIVIENHLSEGDGANGFRPQYGTAMNGRIVYNDAIIKQPNDNGIFVNGWLAAGAHVYINRPTIYDANDGNDSSNAYIGNGIAVYTLASDDSNIGGTAEDTGGVTITEPRIIDTRGTTQMKDGILCRTLVPASQLRDVDIIDPVEITGFDASADPIAVIDVANKYIKDSRQILVRNNTADGDVSVSDYYSLETNTGASGTVTLTLDDDIEPGPTLYTFEVGAAQAFRIDPEGGSSILPGGTAGQRIESQTIGDRLVLRRASSSTWVIESREGLWAFSTSSSAAPTYTETNVTPDRTYDANSTTLDEVADVLGTLIVDLRARGIVN